MPGPIGLVAGLGMLPVRVAEGALASGREVFVIRLKGFEEPALQDYPGDTVGLGEFGKLIKTLNGAGCRDIVFAGNVSRPDFSALKLDFRGARLLPKVLSAARQGDDALLQTILKELEAEGFTIRGADEIAGHLLAPSGLLAGPEPDEAARRDIERAAHVAREIGRLDVGQGCIVCDGLVLAVEAQEGTDRMLARCAELDLTLRGTPESPRGVLVKIPKPIQDRKIDLPTLGVATVEGVQRAGLAGIAFEAGGALIVDRIAVESTANEAGIFLFGLEPGK
ncbi:MAG: UDP-2,3-diacylglucosamine diphosphatase LpxI [Hyphomonadaceae bacterium]|nr:UDP-2,3-diacylglucosamine diphosphatase LpxI [Hyphomonadaceae bacterium]